MDKQDVKSDSALRSEMVDLLREIREDLRAIRKRLDKMEKPETLYLTDTGTLTARSTTRPEFLTHTSDPSLAEDKFNS